MPAYFDPAQLLGLYLFTIAAVIVLLGVVAGIVVGLIALLVSSRGARNRRVGDEFVGNCVFFALRRWFTKGGYLVIRRSRLGPYPHLLWTPELGSAPVEQFKPIEPRGWWFLVFRGRIVRGDEKPGEVPGGENA